MRIICISDTHGLHKELKLSQADLLIHAGDCTEYGAKDELCDFTKWFCKQPFKYKIFIGGNHDLILQDETQDLKLPKNTFYLKNKLIEIEGVKIYGSPYMLSTMGMAFSKTAAELETMWNSAPKNMDILITHSSDLPLGKINPKLHIHGHNHKKYGLQQINNTIKVNAALCNEKSIMDIEHRVVNKPIILEL